MSVMASTATASRTKTLSNCAMRSLYNAQKPSMRAWFSRSIR